MKTGTKGLEMMKHFEGLELEAYKCAAGVWTIGYGHIKNVQEGDVILKFNKIDILKMTDLPRVVAESYVGSIAVVEIWRKNKIITIEVELGELPEETFVERAENIEENPKLNSFKNSIERAVYKASPFPLAPSEDAFSEQIIFEFRVDSIEIM